MHGFAPPSIAGVASAYHIDAQSFDGVEVTVVTLSGQATFERIAGLLRELEALQPSRVLVDESGLRPGFITPNQIGEIAALWRNATAFRSAWIGVSAPSPVIYGLNRMFQALANAEGRVAVFNSRAAALAWLLGTETGG